MQVKNLTGVTIALIGVDGETAIFPPDDEGCRLRESFVPTGVVSVEVGDGRRLLVPVQERRCRGVRALPRPEPDTLYIVSKYVMPYVYDRPDVVALTDYVQDERGRIQAARGLFRNAK